MFKSRKFVVAMYGITLVAIIGVIANIGVAMGIAGSIAVIASAYIGGNTVSKKYTQSVERDG